MRGRWALVVSLAVVALGVVAAMAAYYLDPARDAVGVMPGAGLALPAETRMVTGIDVRRLVASSLYRRYFRSGAGRLQAFTELQARTGLNPERDVDQVLLSSQGQGGRSGGVAIVFGEFDRQRVTRVVEGQPGVTSRTHEGRPLYVFHPAGAPASAVAFLEDDVVALGTEPEVEQTVTAYAQRSGGLRGNTELMALVQSVRAGVAFWSVGDQTLLGRLPSSLPSSSGMPSLSLPGLKSVVISGDVEPAVSFEAIVQTADDKAAQQIAGLAGMMIAMAQMQSSQRPELKQLASALSFTTEGSRVRVNGRFSDELLAALQKRPGAPATAPAAPPPVAPEPGS